MDDGLKARSDMSAAADHLASLDRATRPRSQFDAMLCRLVLRQPTNGLLGKRDGRRRAMIEALNNRASWLQIRHWRRGTTRVPQWAVDLIRHKLEARAKADLEHVA